MLKKIFFCLFILTALITNTTCNINAPKFSTEEMQNICNLAVMDCYFHNIAKLNKPAQSIFSKEKTIWFEYTARIKFGIDASLMEVEVHKNQVIIRLPQAQALQNPAILDDSITSYSSPDGLFKTIISPEEKLSALEAANQNMLCQLNENPALVQKAENRIKIILANYIQQIGEFSGIEYKIVWEKLP